MEKLRKLSMEVETYSNGRKGLIRLYDEDRIILRIPLQIDELEWLHDLLGNNPLYRDESGQRILLRFVHVIPLIGRDFVEIERRP
jgi:hypothetical protein